MSSHDEKTVDRGRPWIVLTPVVAAGLVLRGAISVLRTAISQRRD